MGCGDEKLSKYLTQTFTAHCNAMICQQVTLLGDAEWPKVADAVIEARATACGAADAIALRRGSALQPETRNAVGGLEGAPQRDLRCGAARCDDAGEYHAGHDVRFCAGAGDPGGLSRTRSGAGNAPRRQWLCGGGGAGERPAAADRCRGAAVGLLQPAK